jgi:hypothetical protein
LRAQASDGDGEPDGTRGFHFKRQLIGKSGKRQIQTVEIGVPLFPLVAN